MAEDGSKQAGIEETLFQLLQAGGGREMEQGNLLILLSLVNLMGIISIINHRMGIRAMAEPDPAVSRPEAVQADGGPGEAAGGGAPSFDPSSLLSMLGGKGGPGVSPGQLAGLLNRLMGPPGGQPQGPAPGEPAGETGPTESKGGGKAG